MIATSFIAAEASESTELDVVSREQRTVVTFNVNEGDEGIEKKKKMAVRCYRVYGELPEAAKTGYTFLGWFTKKDDGEKVRWETESQARRITLSMPTGVSTSTP